MKYAIKNKDEKKYIGKILKKARQEKKLFQHEVGKFLNVHLKVVSDWECGRNMPTVTTFLKLVFYLDIKLEDLKYCN